METLRLEMNPAELCAGICILSVQASDQKDLSSQEFRHAGWRTEIES